MEIKEGMPPKDGEKYVPYSEISSITFLEVLVVIVLSSISIYLIS